MHPTPQPAHRLANSPSSYLRQHASDHVEWFPWGEEALDRAKASQRLIFLSIGFATCHWCHVMSSESFSNQRIGRELSSLFVCIKVDREERADVDDLYIRLVQEMTGSAGWPLTVLLTPDLEPVFGATYLPPYAGRGGPGLLDVARNFAAAWVHGPERLQERARTSLMRLGRSQSKDLRGEWPRDILDRSARALAEDYDDEHGGFGTAPKFPRPHDLRLLLRHGQRGIQPATDAALHSLERMAAGGLHDQLVGGFHRYSTDERWIVPHFEKLLCDTALLVPAYLEGYQVSGRPGLASVARRACDWMLDELMTSEGAMASGHDADSAGGEGAHCTWTQDELVAALGPRLGGRAQERLGVDLDAHLEDGRSVLWLAERVHAGCPEHVDPYADEEWTLIADPLAAARRLRPAPSLDELVVTGWNGLAISALARAHQTLDDERYLAAATRIAEYMRRVLVDEEGGVYSCAYQSQASGLGSLEDHAFAAQGLLDLFESDFQHQWIEDALRITQSIEERFKDPQNGGYFLAQQDRQPLPLRTKDASDGALPSGHGVHASNLVRLGDWTGDGTWTQAAEQALRAVAVQAARQPRRFSSLLMAHDHLEQGPTEIVIAGELEATDTQDLLRAVRSHFRPQKVVALAHAQANSSLLPLVEGKFVAGRAAQAYCCLRWSCSEPVSDPHALRAQLDDLG